MRFNPEIMPLCRWNREVEEEEEGGETSSLVISPGRERAFPFSLREEKLLSRRGERMISSRKNRGQILLPLLRSEITMICREIRPNPRLDKGGRYRSS